MCLLKLITFQYHCCVFLILKQQSIIVKIKQSMTKKTN